MSHTLICFHCGEPVADGACFLATVGGRSDPTCCIGCKAAAEWIHTLGLADYYRLREQPAERATRTADFSAWDRPQLQRLYVRELDGEVCETAVLVEGMRCTACSWLIERAMSGAPGIKELLINPAAKRLHITWRRDATTLSQILARLARLGYTPHPLDAQSLDAVALHESRGALKRLTVAGLGMMQSMMYAVALYAGAFEGMQPVTREFFRWLGLLVTTPVVFYAAQPFFAGALRELRARTLGMDTMIAAAVALIYFASMYETISGGAQVYFDSASMFVFFLLAGRYLEMRARHKASDVVDALARLQPALAQRRGANGALETVGVHELETGDSLVIDSGAAIPADGTLCSTSCEVDESLLTGESTARLRHAGDDLIAGSIARTGPVEMRVTRIGAQTVLSGIVRLISRAYAQRPRAALLGDRIAARFVASVLVLAIVTAVAWSVFDPTRAFAAALSVLVVSCPCAFALSVPIAHLRAAASLARMGVLIPRTDALEKLARFDRIAFDKTGTLTEHRLELTRIDACAALSADECLRIAQALEETSSHLFARAVREAARDMAGAKKTARNARTVVGAGIEGEIDGCRYRIGHGDFAAPDTIAARDDADDVVLADTTRIFARFQFRETLRADAPAAVDALRAQRIEPMILSGDSQARVAALAARLNIAAYRARLTPAGKLHALQELRAGGHVVAMVGDGVNDAPVLAGADVAIALAAGAPLAQSNADIVLTSDRLDAIAASRTIAQRTLRILRQNLYWAAVYNFTGIPLAALGYIPPWLAAIGMSASSLLVVLNSLRIAPAKTRATAGVGASATYPIVATA
jgi:Cu2+-exporting ATPase